jgi:glycosyltransferase involved in cell wall biosynthesis
MSTQDERRIDDAPARVVINGRFLAQRQTGVQRYALQTTLALDELLGADAEIRRRLHIEFAMPTAATAPPLRHMRITTLPGPRGHLWEQWSLARFARDAYLVNFSYSGPLAHRRQMITVHDATVAVSPETFSPAYRWTHRALIALLRRRVDTVMTVSQFSRNELQRHFGIDEALVGVEGWQHGVAEGDGLATVRKYGLEPQRYILAVGSHKPNKNFEVVDRALALMDEVPFSFAIAGADDIGLFRHARGAERFARMLGYVSDRELGHLYKHAAWFVFPSLYEGFGLPAVEAMANGCPVIAAHAASIPEVCGDAALYFDPRDPVALANLLREAIARPALRVPLLERARARLRAYSWRANAQIIAERLLLQGAA